MPTVALCCAGAAGWADEVDDHIAALQGPGTDRQVDAAAALAELGPAAEKAVPALRKALKRKDPLVAVYAAWALASITEDVEEYLPHLTRGLQSDDLKVVLGSAWALGRLGSRAKGAVPALEALLTSPLSGRPLIANGALLSVTGNAERYLGPVLTGLGSDSAAERSISAFGLSYGFGHDIPGLESMVQAAADADDPELVTTAKAFVEGAVRARLAGASPAEAMSAGTDQMGKVTGGQEAGVGDAPGAEPLRPGPGAVTPPSMSHEMKGDGYTFRLTLSPEVRVEDGELVVDLHPSRKVLQSEGMVGVLTGKVSDEIEPPYEFTEVTLTSPVGRVYDLGEGRAPLVDGEARDGKWKLVVVVKLEEDIRQSEFVASLQLPDEPQEQGRPDLLVTQIRIGEDRRIEAVIRNGGTATAKVGGNIEFRVSFQEGRHLRGLDAVDWSFTDPAQFVRSLAPGATVTVRTADYGRVSTGAQRVRVIVDRGNLVKESDETNNTLEVDVAASPPGIRFVEWVSWRDKWLTDGRLLVPQYRNETDAVSARRPFEVEVTFEQRPPEATIEVQLTGGAKPVTLTAIPVGDGNVFRTRPLALLPAGFDEANRQCQGQMDQTEQGHSELVTGPLSDLQKELRALDDSIRKIEYELVGLRQGNSSEYRQKHAELHRVLDERRSKRGEAARVKARSMALEQRLEQLRFGTNPFLGAEVAEEQYDTTTGRRTERPADPALGIPAADGAVLRATHDGQTAQVNTSIPFDCSMDVSVSVRAGSCTGGGEGEERSAYDDIPLVIAGDVITITATVHSVTGTMEHRYPPAIELTIPGTRVQETVEIDELAPGEPVKAVFTIDTGQPPEDDSRTARRLDQGAVRWDLSEILPALRSHAWARHYAGGLHPVALNVRVKMSSKDSFPWNNEATVGLVMGHATPEVILCYIREQARKRAEGDPPTIADSQFYRFLTSPWQTPGATPLHDDVTRPCLHEYLRNPSPDAGLAAVQSIGDPTGIGETVMSAWEGPDAIEDLQTYLVKLYVPPKVREKYPEMPEWLHPASRFWLTYYRKRVRRIDSDFLVCDRDPSNVMHWATGVGYYYLPADALREMFLGYEAWHLEGWDVFGGDALNDMIAEEQGRIFGGLLASGIVKDEPDLIRKMDTAFMQARAWVGSLIALRQDELDAMILAPKLPQGQLWRARPTSWTPWTGESITEMLDSGQSKEQVQASQLVRDLIQIYALIYEAEIWPERSGRTVTLTPTMRNIALGRYDSQFDAADKDWNSTWEFDPDRLDP